MKQLLEKVKCIAFDADDTLWVNEPYFRKAEEEYCRVLGRFAQPQEIIGALYQTELKTWLHTDMVPRRLPFPLWRLR